MDEHNRHINVSDPDKAAVETVLDSLDALVYVADMQTHELLFVNAYGRRVWGEPGERKCWQFLQAAQSGPCSFCTNPKLLDEQGQPTGTLVWEFRNTVNQHWYQCRDQAVRWTDGRLVRIEVAVDITEIKTLQTELEAAQKRAEALAHSDELTGLNNRRAYFALGEHIVRQARRYAYPLAVIMFDADCFKQINDRFGHAAGDEVLRQIGAISSALVREADVLARIGGEEFAICLSGTNEHEAAEMAERLREAVQGLYVAYGDQRISLTCSFGVAASATGNASLDELLNRADKALYRAKSDGRNRVVLASSLVP